MQNRSLPYCRVNLTYMYLILSLRVKIVNYRLPCPEYPVIWFMLGLFHFVPLISAVLKYVDNLCWSYT